MATDKRTKYRQKMEERGLVQANEWVPSDRRELMREFARSLREGTAPVPRDHARATESIELEFFRAVRDVLIEVMDEEQRAAITAEALDRIEKSLGTGEG